MDGFDAELDKMMAAAMEYERLRRRGEPVPAELARRLDESGAWLRGLSDEDYSRLIH